MSQNDSESESAPGRRTKPEQTQSDCICANDGQLHSSKFKLEGMFYLKFSNLNLKLECQCKSKYNKSMRVIKAVAILLNTRPPGQHVGDGKAKGLGA